MFEAERTEEELDEQWSLAVENPSIWPGMSYADGVKATIEWIRGDRDEGPMEDE